MKLKAMVVLALVAGAVAFSGLAGARAAQMMAAQPTAVAVIDVQGIYDKLDEKKDIEANAKQKLDDFNKENEARRKKLADLDADLKTLGDPGSSGYSKKLEEYERQAMDLQAWTAFQQQKAKRERSMQLEAMYRKMCDAAGRAAQQQGYDIVLFKEPTINLQDVAPEALMTAIQIRKIIWSDPKMDISGSVVQLLNNEYKNPKK